MGLDGRRDENEERERQRERGTGVGLFVFASRRARTCRLADCGLRQGGGKTPNPERGTLPRELTATSNLGELLLRWALAWALAWALV